MLEWWRDTDKVKRATLMLSYNAQSALLWMFRAATKTRPYRNRMDRLKHYENPLGGLMTTTGPTT